MKNFNEYIELHEGIFDKIKKALFKLGDKGMEKMLKSVKDKIGKDVEDTDKVNKDHKLKDKFDSAYKAFFDKNPSADKLQALLGLLPGAGEPIQLLHSLARQRVSDKINRTRREKSSFASASGRTNKGLDRMKKRLGGRFTKRFDQIWEELDLESDNENIKE